MHGESQRRRELGGFCHRKGFFESDPRALFCFSEAESRTLTQGASLVRASEVNKKIKKNKKLGCCCNTMQLRLGQAVKSAQALPKGQSKKKNTFVGAVVVLGSCGSTAVSSLASQLEGCKFDSYCIVLLTPPGTCHPTSGAR